MGSDGAATRPAAAPDPGSGAYRGVFAPDGRRGTATTLRLLASRTADEPGAQTRAHAALRRPDAGCPATCSPSIATSASTSSPSPSAVDSEFSASWYSPASAGANGGQGHPR